MAFCVLSKDIADDYVLLSNTFITQFVSSCDEMQLKVYLYALYLSNRQNSSENTIDTMQVALNYSKEQVIDTLVDLSKLSLVTIISYEPLSIRIEKIKDYISVRKFKKEKYTDFNQQLDGLFPSQAHINPNFYLTFYDFMEDSKISPEVMIMIAHYCVYKKGEKISTNYILTVARNWIAEGVRTVEQVESKIQQMDAVTDSLITLAKELGKKSEIAIEDQQFFIKWTNNWGFGYDVILLTAKTCKKRGGMEKLDSKLDELFKAGCIALADAQNYWNNKQNMLDNAILINKTLGLWYDNLDYIVEKYVAPWIAKGFDFEAVQLVADYCFRSSIRTLEGMNNAIIKFFKQGCVTTASINEYLGNLVTIDNKIKKLISITASARNVTNQDRELYKLWTVNWAISDELIEYACSLAVGKPYAFSYVNNLLAKWNKEGVTCVQAAQANSTADTKKENFTFNANDRSYSKEELDAFFMNISQLEDLEI